MSFCARCGSATNASMTFCPSCGEDLPRVTPSAATLESAPHDATRPRGRVQSPGLVLLLTLVTLGIYSMIYWLRVSREIDAYTGKPGHATKMTRRGLLIMVTVVLVVLATFVGFGANAVGVEASSEQNAVAALIGFFAIVILAAIAGTVGAIFYYIGHWRVWQGIETDERARGHASPISPILLLVLLLIPYVNLVGMWFVLYQTQAHLNGVWSS